MFCLFVLILYMSYILVNNFLSHIGMGHPGFNQSTKQRTGEMETDM